MSLSVEEKVRVAHILDDLGVPMIEAGFPASNPKEAELFERLRDAGLRADVCAFGMTRRRDVAAPRTTRRCACWPSPATPVCTLVGKTWGLHLEKVVRVDREENLRDDRASRSRSWWPRASASIYDAEHFFDGYRDDRAVRASRCLRAALRGAAPRTLTLCDTNGASLPHEVAEAVARRAARARRTPRSASTRHNDAECARGQLARRGRRGRRARAGHDERLRRALRQREPRSRSSPTSSSRWATSACRRWRG